jgi:hypothetical protein
VIQNVIKRILKTQKMVQNHVILTLCHM